MRQGGSRGGQRQAGSRQNAVSQPAAAADVSAGVAGESGVVTGLAGSEGWLVSGMSDRVRLRAEPVTRIRDAAETGADGRSPCLVGRGWAGRKLEARSPR